MLQARGLPTSLQFTATMDMIILAGMSSIGDNTILGFAGYDTLDGDEGDDSINPGSNTGGGDVVFGSTGTDRIDIPVVRRSLSTN